MNSNELENLIKLRDSMQEALSSKFFKSDICFLRLYNKTDDKITQEKIETIAL